MTRVIPAGPCPDCGYYVGRIAELEASMAKLEAVRAEAQRTEAYMRIAQDPDLYDVCFNGIEPHATDCPVPALRAALDAAKDAP